MSDMTMNALDFLVQLLAGALAFWYAGRFLRSDFESRRWALFRWAALYALVQFSFSTLTTEWKPYERFFAIVPHFALLFLLSGAFLQRTSFGKCSLLRASSPAGISCGSQSVRWLTRLSALGDQPGLGR